jgi:signal transduction histidine kinase
MTSPVPHPASAASVLVVDDTEQNLLAMRALLEQPGVPVILARSGPDALELLLTHEVALALLDVQMPEMDGFALAELMRGAQRTAHVPIIFLTAASEDQQRTFRGYEAGAVDFLHKPIEPRMLNTKVRVFVELYQQRQQLLLRMAELERAVKLNETMTAVLAHDLRTPLSAIMMSAELVKLRAAEAPVQQAGTRIKSSAARMARMIDQLLDFSRIRLGLLRVNPLPANLESVCEAALAEVRQALPEADIRLHLQGEMTGTFDPDRLMQVLINLAVNAVQHGCVDRPVEIQVDGRDAARLKVRVRNDGALPEGVREHLFTPFREGRPKESSGLGLGLYIVDQFVQAHGGSVAVHTEEPPATVFEIEIPRHTAVL